MKANDVSIMATRPCDFSQGILSEKRRLEAFSRAQHLEGWTPYPDDWSG
jgi:hypothetical protein